MREYRYYSSPIKLDEDRIKPRKKRTKSDRTVNLVYKSVNPFTGEEVEECIGEDDSESKKAASEYASYARSRKVIFDICMSNVWEYFVTFTFNKEKVDRYSFDECSKRMVEWLKRVKKKFVPDLKYVIVPERHKDGAWHFHGLFAECGNLTFVDSGVKDRKGRVIYNLYEYRYGFTTATAIDDNLATCLYLQKYITKDLCGALFNKKRYWCSRNLDRPKVTKDFVGFSLEEFEKSIDDEIYQKNVVCGDFYDIHQYVIYEKDYN